MRVRALVSAGNIKQPTSRFLIKKLLVDAYRHKKTRLLRCASDGFLFHSKHIKDKLIKNERNMRYRISVILIAGVGTDHPVYFIFNY